MAVTKTIQFLPDIFRTDTNKKFLNATVDQLINETNVKKVNGYVGRKLSPSYKSTDNYIVESSADRQNYQLEPSLIIRNAVNGNVDFATTYPDIINQIKYYGGLTDQHNRLFDNEYYTYSPRIDLDKFVNFSQYYWLENGPDTVEVSAAGVPLQYTYDVTYDYNTQTWLFTGYGLVNNPTITLARGGVYKFVVNEPGNPFWIQSRPGATGYDINLPNVYTRDVLGVENNGTDVGTVTFSVPSVTAQLQWTSMSLAASVDYATDLSYQQVQGANPQDLFKELGGIDGNGASLEGRSIIFVNNELIDDEFWNDSPAVVSNGVVYFDYFDLTIFDSLDSPFDPVEYVTFTKRNDVYNIQILPDVQGIDRIVITPAISVTDEQKIRVKGGKKYAGLEFYSRYDLLHQVPLITAPLDNLYYQNSNANAAVGSLKIINPANAVIDPLLDILGNLNYTSPNGIVFTNGLRIQFDSSATADYANNIFYVEGVGNNIRLIPEEVLITDEFDSNSEQDYITINRGSIDANGWSRSNRWFHYNVIEQTAAYNNVPPLFDQNVRANRPIIEFDADIQLYNFGSESKIAVDIADTLITNAYDQVQGVTTGNPTTLTLTIDGKTAVFTTGTRVIFANDLNNNVRNKIYNFTVEKNKDIPATYIAYIEEADDAIVETNHCVLIKHGDSYTTTATPVQVHYNGTAWLTSQQKVSKNQTPKFDVIDSNGISFSNQTVYPGNDFTGTNIFSYLEGTTGPVDPILGFRLSYKNFISQGDIQFHNDYDIDTFTYVSGNGTETVRINTGLLQKNLNRSTSTRQNIWTIAQTMSRQYQVYSFLYDGTNNIFPIDNLPDDDGEIPNVRVTVNNKVIPNGNYALTQVVDRVGILINPEVITAGDAIFVAIYNSNIALPGAYYEIPPNLDINSLNKNIQTLTLGQIRNHLVKLKDNSTSVVGTVPGNSNLRDIQYLNKGGSILQHSAPVVYAGLFLSHPTLNFVNSIKYAAQEYEKFKIKFLELAVNLELDRANIADSVDQILIKINNVKNSSFPWYYSDMLPYGPNNKTVLPTRSVLNPQIRSYELTSIFEDKKISNKSVLVYLKRTVAGITTTVQLVKDQDFYFNQDRPAITFYDTFSLLYNDEITIIEYADTNGSYIPETPTKLGLYPKFVPEIYLDDTYRSPVNVIQGHDGSIIPAFGDFRDDFLIELERRIYNNIKVDYNIYLFNINDYVPGKFRVTNYSRQEFTEVLSQGFLNWVGNNRIDYTTNNIFRASDQFTWNFRSFRDALNGESLPGTWRSIFRYFYDTDRPHTHPWEMLGFSQMPDWWQERYGPAPYTGGNMILWSDLSQGYIHAGERAGFDIRYLRPNLTFIIPVDDSGNLKPPTEIGGIDPTTGQRYALVSDFDSDRANRSYSVGDIGPAELAWRRSSDYVFTLQLALALTKPAKYFSLLSNTQNYRRNLVTAQFEVVTSSQHITPNSVLINGYNNTDTGVLERSTGYINWIRDYVKSLGISAAAELIKTNLSQLNVQLSYKMAGYTDKRYLTLLAEQSSPSSINDSVTIPDENYSIELYKGSPLTKVSYSGVIVERSARGYTVSGYNTDNPYFYIIPSQVNNNFYTIDVGTQRGYIFKDYRKSKVTIPYGLEYNTVQEVVDFLVSYQRYLQAQGFVFTDYDEQLNERKDWVLSAKEFLHWSAQGWKPGSILVLSPAAGQLKVYDSEGVVDEITNTPQGSRILDVNYRVIKKNEFTIAREDNLFSIKALADQTIGFAELVVVQNEHLLILDNSTVFQDIIYVPELGNRQYRIKMVGSKTANWNGSLELPGFIYNNEEFDTWNPGTDYLKGSIVKHKSNYYTALQNIEAASQFQVNYWKLIPTDQLKTGMINNFATNASQSLSYYDIDNQPIDEQIQLFSNGLIGFRSRDYFTNLGIDTITQSKFYQGLIKQKGTKNAVNALQGATFNNLDTSINYYENWAVRVGEYGATDVNTFIEIPLDETKLTTNPSPLQFIDADVAAQAGIATYTQADIYKSAGAYTANLFRTESMNQAPLLKQLPVAGFVNQNDVDATIFSLGEYPTLTTIINNIGTGYKIWTARDFKGEWNVYRVNIVPGIAFALRHVVDDQVEVIVNQDHNLAVNDLVALKNLDPRYNGVYKISQIIDTTRFYITMYQNLASLVQSQAVVGNGLLYKFVSTKINNPSVIDSIKPSTGWLTNDKVWVENLDSNGDWGVYNKTETWNYSTKVELNSSQYGGNDHFGHSVSISPNNQLMFVGAPESGAGRVSFFIRSGLNWNPSGFYNGTSTNLSKFGQVVVNGEGYVAISAPNSNNGEGYVYLYKEQTLIQILTNPVAAPNDQFGAALAMSDDGRYLYVGSPGSSQVFCYALTTRNSAVQTITSTGAGSYTLDTALLATLAGDIVVTNTLRNIEYIPDVDYTISGSDIVFSSAPVSQDKLAITKQGDYYKLIGTLPGEESAGSNNFGISIVCNKAGSTIAIGADKETVAGTTQAGAVYVYHRTMTDFTTNGVNGTFICPDNFNSVLSVSLDGDVLRNGVDYYIIDNKVVQFDLINTPVVGLILTAETNQFKFDQKLTATIAGDSVKFGDVLAMCSTGCNIYSSSPGYKEPSYRSGLVTRLINVGRVFGSVTGTVHNPTVTAGDKIVINNRSVTISGSSLDQVVADINAAIIPGITAENYNGYIKINSKVIVPGEKLDIKTGTGTVISDLGILVYKVGQSIRHPEGSGENFGISLAVSSDTGVLAVGSQGADIEQVDTLDIGRTTFDSNSTRFTKFVKDSGAVYIFNLMANPFETVDNPALYNYTQKLSGPNIQTGVNFGASIAIGNEIVACGVSNDPSIRNGGGSVYTYYNKDNKPGWELIRYKQPKVDIDALNSAFMYNSKTKLLINYFDYIDPAKGKILGVADQFIDLKESMDPARYNYATTGDVTASNYFYWAEKQVGKTWWDLSQASFIDYEQDTLQYRLKNWGKLFPGSLVKIYEWVESNYLPSQYVTMGGNGTPKYPNNTSYTSVTAVDPSTGVITQKYYYWVSDKSTVDKVKTNRNISVLDLEKFILSPKDQGIPYLGLLAPNSIALYNVADKFVGTEIVLHLDNGANRNQNLIHNEYQLIQEGNPLANIPQRIVNKLRDSLVGFDSKEFLIPDPNLPLQDQLGISLRPRQGMFINKLAARKIFVNSVNKVFKTEPIFLNTTPVTLFKEPARPLPEIDYDIVVDSELQLSLIDPAVFVGNYRVYIPSDSNFNGKWTIWQYDQVSKGYNIIRIQSYKTTEFWEAVNWFSDTYIPGKDIDYTVNTYGEIQTLDIVTGDYIKVLDGGQGLWLEYEAMSDGTFNLVAAEAATLQIKSNTYDVTTGSGFDSVLLELSAFDSQSGFELANMFDSVYNEIFIKDLAVDFNELFFALVNYLFSEQISPDWIFKTSFIDVAHKLRNLDQIPNYVRDNQTFYQDYINEVKPYRTILREYIPNYTSIDNATGSWTDFDLLPFYDKTTGTFRSPEVTNSADQTILGTLPWSEWTNNYTFKVSDYIVGNVGIGYDIAPNVEITGGGGTGASAITTINPSTGQVTGIQVVNPGIGYTSTPTVVINGVGRGATAYPLLKNEFNSSDASLSYNTVRNIETSLTFDRTHYSSNIEVWVGNIGKQYYQTIIQTGTGTGNLWITSGNIVTYNNDAYVIDSNWTLTSELFDYSKVTRLDSGNVLLRAVDRQAAYYAPTLNSVAALNTYLPGGEPDQTMSGIEYPGTMIKGPSFNANAFTFNSNVIGFDYTGLRITSANIDLANFEDLEFVQDQSLKIEAQVPFPFVNNGIFQIVSVTSSEMMLSGDTPIQTVANLYLDSAITVNMGDIITQANSVGNAYVMNSVSNSNFVSIVYNVPGLSADPYSTIKINGLPTTTKITGSDATGTANVTIAYLDLFNTLDSNIYSTYHDTALGTRPEDINIEGGAYVDIYNSHAPEELIPGRIFDALELRVFTNNTSNTASYGFREFQPMRGNIEFYRIDANATTTLSANLSMTDHEILVADASKLPDPSATLGIPGTVFINGEKIHYYQKYDAAKLSTAVSWTANTNIPVDTLITLDSNVYLTTGNVYATAIEYVNSANIQLITLNSLRQLRRGVDGTGTANITAVASSGQSSLPFTYTPPLIPGAWQANLVIPTLFANVNIRNVGQGQGDLFFKPDGTKMYTTDLVTDRVYEYTLGTAWDVTTASNVADVSISTQETSSSALFFKPDGTKMYVIGTAQDRVFEYTLGTPWQVNTASNVGTSVQTTSGGTSEGTPYALFFRPDGTSYYISGAGTDRVKRYDMTVPWQVNTAAYYSQSAAITSIEPSPAGLSFHPDGLKMFVVGNQLSPGNDSILEYDLATAWDPTTITLVANSAELLGIGLSSRVNQGIFWKPDGTSVFIIDLNRDDVSEFRLSPVAPNATTTNNTIVSDSSLVQALPNTAITSTTLSGSFKVTANVTWKLTLSSNITANIGDYITQFIGNTGNVRVLDSITNANVVAVDIVTGNLTFATNIGTRVNVTSLTDGVTSTVANIIAMQPLGQVNANGNVVLSGVTILNSNTWIALGSGLGIEGSTTEAAEFIRAEPSYTP